jgi:hypothetical protein
MRRQLALHTVAFDLTAFDLGFAARTDHPRVGWSPRLPAAVRRPACPGRTASTISDRLVTDGMVSPALVADTVATFTAFQREHGAFGTAIWRAAIGSHYGFIEQGVCSAAAAGPCDPYVLDDGAVHMSTWSQADDCLLARIRYARQNGVPGRAWTRRSGGRLPRGAGRSDGGPATGPAPPPASCARCGPAPASRKRTAGAF